MGPKRSGKSFKRRESGASWARTVMAPANNSIAITAPIRAFSLGGFFSKIRILPSFRKHKLRLLMIASDQARFLIDNPYYKLIEDAIGYLHENAGREPSLG